MTDELDRAWASLAAGGVEVPNDPRIVGALRQRVADRMGDPDSGSRREALTVCSGLAAEGGLELLARFSADPDASLRVRALDVALGHGVAGLQVVRAFLSDPTPDVALRALDAVADAGDRAATPRLRALLDAPHAEVRAAACHLLGYLAGVVVRPAIASLTTSDPDLHVRAVAAEALQRLDGAIPRGPAVRYDRSKTESTNPLSQSAPTLPAAPAPKGGPDEWIVAVRRFGAGEPGATLDGLDLAALAVVIAKCTPGDPALTRGAALGIRRLGSASHVGVARRWLTDPNPGVREAAFDAVADLGGPSVLPALGAGLSDADANVRSTALSAVLRAAARLGAGVAVRRYVAGATQSKDPVLASAARLALVELPS